MMRQKLWVVEGREVLEFRTTMSFDVFGEYGRDWVLVCAYSKESALKVAEEYNENQKLDIFLPTVLVTDLAF